MEALGRVEKTNEELMSLLRLLPRGKSPNVSLNAESPGRHLARQMPEREKIANEGASPELAMIKLQLENMQLGMQAAHEEMKTLRTRSDKFQEELVAARAQAAHFQGAAEHGESALAAAQEEAVRLKKNHAELAESLAVRAKQAEDRCLELQDECSSISSQHTNYARIVFRLSKRCCSVLQRWSNVPNWYCTASCFRMWVQNLHQRRRFRIVMAAAVLRRAYHVKRCAINTWFRAAARAMMQQVKIGASPARLHQRQASQVKLGLMFEDRSKSPPDLPASAPQSKPASSRSPLDTLQKLKRVYGNPAMAAGFTMPASESAGSSCNPGGPLDWFLEQYDAKGKDERKRFLALNQLEASRTTVHAGEMVLEADVGVHLVQSPSPVKTMQASRGGGEMNLSRQINASFHGDMHKENRSSNIRRSASHQSPPGWHSTVLPSALQPHVGEMRATLATSPSLTQLSPTPLQPQKTQAAIWMGGEGESQESGAQYETDIRDSDIFDRAHSLFLANNYTPDRRAQIEPEKHPDPAMADCTVAGWGADMRDVGSTEFSRDERMVIDDGPGSANHWLQNRETEKRSTTSHTAVLYAEAAQEALHALTAHYQGPAQHANTAQTVLSATQQMNSGPWTHTVGPTENLKGFSQAADVQWGVHSEVANGKTTWEKVEETKPFGVQDVIAFPHSRTTFSNDIAAGSEDTAAATAIFPPTQAQWARQNLSEKLDLESPRILETQRGTQRKSAILKRVPWAH